MITAARVTTGQLSAVVVELARQAANLLVYCPVRLGNTDRLYESDEHDEHSGEKDFTRLVHGRYLRRGKGRVRHRNHVDSCNLKKSDSSQYLRLSLPHWHCRRASNLSLNASPDIRTPMQV